MAGNAAAECELVRTHPDLFGESSGSAIMSNCGRYRYSLHRQWEDGLPSVLFVMLNPSTANANTDDPALRRCIAYAKSCGCGGLTVVNLFAFRATDPAVLLTIDYETAVGPENDMWIAISAMCHRARNRNLIVAAWGAYASRPQLNKRLKEVYRLLPISELRALDRTQCCQPRHPLYCRAGWRPQLMSEMDAQGEQTNERD